MFEFLKKKKAVKTEEVNDNFPVELSDPAQDTGNEDAEETSLPVVTVAEDKKALKKKKNEITAYEKKDGESFKADDGDAAVFSKLLGETTEQVKDDFRLHGIRRFCERLGKLNVRYELKDSDAVKIVENCFKLGVSEILVSPAYLSVYRNAVNKTGISGQKICALIDFPFGESTYKSKITDIKACLKYGVDGFTVVMPAVAVKDTGDFKSQMKKLGKATKRPMGVAFSASELDVEQIKLILKTAEKKGLNSLTFAFGDETEAAIRGKCEIIRKNKGKTEIRILGNVKTAEAVAAVCKLGADKVITPFADEIAKDLAKKFNIKKIKLS